jgi:hypothetical protein
VKQFSCLIKGPPIVAEAAAIGRGLEVVTPQPRLFKRDSTFVRVRATDDAFSTLASWLSERPPMITGHGFPAGTLLHFSGVEG